MNEVRYPAGGPSPSSSIPHISRHIQHGMLLLAYACLSLCCLPSTLITDVPNALTERLTNFTKICICPSHYAFPSGQSKHIFVSCEQGYCTNDASQHMTVSMILHMVDKYSAVLLLDAASIPVPVPCAQPSQHDRQRSIAVPGKARHDGRCCSHHPHIMPV